MTKKNWKFKKKLISTILKVELSDDQKKCLSNWSYLAISQRIRSAPAPNGTDWHRTGTDRQKIARLGIFRIFKFFVTHLVELISGYLVPVGTGPLPVCSVWCRCRPNLLSDRRKRCIFNKLIDLQWSHLGCPKDVIWRHLTSVTSYDVKWRHLTSMTSYDVIWLFEKYFLFFL